MEKAGYTIGWPLSAKKCFLLNEKLMNNFDTYIMFKLHLKIYHILLSGTILSLD